MVPALKFYTFLYEQIPIILWNELTGLTVSLLLLLLTQQSCQKANSLTNISKQSNLYWKGSLIILHCAKNSSVSQRYHCCDKNDMPVRYPHSRNAALLPRKPCITRAPELVPPESVHRGGSNFWKWSSFGLLRVEGIGRAWPTQDYNCMGEFIKHGWYDLLRWFNNSYMSNPHHVSHVSGCSKKGSIFMPQDVPVGRTS